MLSLVLLQSMERYMLFSCQSAVLVNLPTACDKQVPIFVCYDVEDPRKGAAFLLEHDDAICCIAPPQPPLLGFMC